MGRHLSVFATGLILIVAIAACGDDSTEDGTAAPDTIAGVVEVPVAGRDHVGGADVEYPSSPPAGGDHFDAWQNCGFYTVELRDEVAVHALEHGTVWITWTDDASEADLALIEGLAVEADHILASPYPTQTSPFVLTAWGRQLPLQEIEDPRVDAFIEEFEGRASPTAPEPGAACEGAIGVPPDDPMANYDAALSQIEG